MLKAPVDKPSYRPGGGQKAVRAGTLNARDVPKPGEGYDPKYWKQVWVKDPAGFKKKKWVRKASKSNIPPPSVLTRKEQEKKKSPSARYASKEPKPRTPKPLPKSQPRKRGGGAVGGGRK